MTRDSLNDILSHLTEAQKARVLVNGRKLAAPNNRERVRPIGKGADVPALGLTTHLPRASAGSAASVKRGTSYTVTLPLPPRELSPNSRPHWTVKARAVATCKNEAVLAVFMKYGAQHNPLDRATVRYNFYFPDKRRRDADNAEASCKAYLDGLRRAGCIRDDDTTHLTRLPSTFQVDAELPRLVIEINPLRQERG